MGHAIDFITVEKKKDIMAAANEFAYYNGDRYEGSDVYHGNLTILENPILEDEEAAIEYIKKISGNKSYNDFAVQFKYKIQRPDTKAILKLREQIKALYEKKYIEYDKKNTQAKRRRIEDLNYKIFEKQDKLDNLYRKNRNKTNKIFWMVKVEVHC